MSTPKTHSDPLAATLRVTEIYRSIQGESTWVGKPCTFVRLARCHLRCVWCDTEYAFYGGEKVSIGEIVRKCESMECPLVEVTGGEPLVQPECPSLVQALLDKEFTVLVETSGTLPIRDLPSEAIKIMDLKCPASGECDKNDWSNIDALAPQDEVKFVIADRSDFEWARDVVRRYDLPARCNAVLFSPVFGAVEPADLVRWILDEGLDVRFQLQLHKCVWAPDAKGV